MRQRRFWEAAQPVGGCISSKGRRRRPGPCSPGPHSPGPWDPRPGIPKPYKGQWPKSASASLLSWRWQKVSRGSYCESEQRSDGLLLPTRVRGRAVIYLGPPQAQGPQHSLAHSSRGKQSGTTLKPYLASPKLPARISPEEQPASECTEAVEHH